MGQGWPPATEHRDSYRVQLDRVTAQIGGVRVRALTVERVRRMIADMVANGLSSSSITGSRVNLGIVAANPVARTSPPPKRQRAQKRSLTAEETARLLTQLGAHPARRRRRHPVPEQFGLIMAFCAAVLGLIVPPARVAGRRAVTVRGR